MSTKKEWAEEWAKDDFIKVLPEWLSPPIRRGAFLKPVRDAYLAGFDRAIEEVMKNRTDLCDQRGHTIEAVPTYDIEKLGGEDEKE
jgi:hypothetical protein